MNKEKTTFKANYFKDLEEFKRFCVEKTAKNPNVNIYAVIGSPVGHSMSPLLHHELGCEIDYCAVKVETNELKEFCGIASKYLKGFNITVPHKFSIIEHLANVDEFAKNLASVNTVKVENGILSGYNTDVYGLQKAIQYESDLKGFDTAIILGSGGAAKAAVYAVKQLKLKPIIAARNVEKAREVFPNESIIDIEGNLPQAQLCINCTPCGMLGQEEKLAADLSQIKGLKLFYDTVYNPLKTSHIKVAEQMGIKCSNGLGMLILQGAKAREIWQGIMPEFVLNRLKARLSAEIFKKKLIKPLVFTGFMASGKSTVANYIAKLCDLTAIDTDSEVECATGKEIKELFAEFGELGFREREYSVIKSLSFETSKIISLGGGAITYADTAEYLKKNATIVYINTPLDECLKRASVSLTNRPLLSKPYSEIKKLYDGRTAIYLNSADIVIDGSLTLDTVLMTLMQSL